MTYVNILDLIYIDYRSKIQLLTIFRLQVWFNGRTSASQADDAGSIPVTCFKALRSPGIKGNHAGAFYKNAAASA